jgi:hypothetical protein
VTSPSNRPKIPQPLPSSVHAQRRASGGPRKADSEHLTLRQGNRLIAGWTLNISRGGARLVIEEPVAVGEAWDLLLHESTAYRPVRVVWVRDEAGGQIVGVQYLDTDGTIPPFDGPHDTP